jgi:hypothetical protein
MRGMWIDRVEARMDEQAERSDLEGRVAKLETMLTNALAWIADLGEDTLDRTANTHTGGLDG